MLPRTARSRRMPVARQALRTSRLEGAAFGDQPRRRSSCSVAFPRRQSSTVQLALDEQTELRNVLTTARKFFSLSPMLQSTFRLATFFILLPVSRCDLVGTVERPPRGVDRKRADRASPNGCGLPPGDRRRRGPRRVSTPSRKLSEGNCRYPSGCRAAALGARTHRAAHAGTLSR